MLPVSKLKELTSYVSYKPGWEFEVYEHQHDGPHLVVRVRLEDAQNAGHMTHLRYDDALPPFETNKQYFEFLLWRLKRIETHECLDFFKVSGETYNDPHKEGS